MSNKKNKSPDKEAQGEGTPFPDSMVQMMSACCPETIGGDTASIDPQKMQKMMESCFSKMDPKQREDMLTMCREMFNRVEKKGKNT
ncbi:hypothetical protein ACFLUH_03685 [Chloroflexota bacterium]